MIDLINDCSMEGLLTAWGRWAKSGGIGNSSLGYKSFNAIILGQCSGGGGGVAVDQDDEMMTVDRAMSQLKKTDPFYFKILKLRYLYGYSYTRLASKLSKDLPEYYKNHKRMCHKTAKAHIEDAQEAVKVFL